MDRKITRQRVRVVGKITREEIGKRKSNDSPDIPDSGAWRHPQPPRLRGRNREGGGGMRKGGQERG